MMLRESGEYSLCFPQLYYTYSPWTSPEFCSLYATVKPNSLVSADRCHVLMQLAQQACLHDGHFAECGVFKGLADAWKMVRHGTQ